MAEAILGNQDQYSCSVCLDLLRDPVTIPCGHSYCMSCITECWNTNDQNGTYRCPQCRHTYNSKPPLNRSTVLAEIMEKLRSVELSENAQSLAGPGEIACDFCCGEMIKAVKSCLECRASYCEIHVQSHYNVPALKKHKLMIAAVIPVCPKHDKLLEVYCRTDQKCVCMHCLLDDHKGHDTVPSTIERKEKQTKLTHSQTKVKQTIQAKEKELHKLKMDITSHSDSAKKAVETSKKVFSELVKLIEKRSNEVIEEIEAQEKADLEQGTKLKKKLEEDIAALKKREGVLDELLQTDDNIQFLQDYESVSSSSGSEGFHNHSFKPCCSYPNVNKHVCELKERLETIFNQEINKTFQKVSDLSVKNHPNCIKVGDRVRVKPSIKTPKFNWGGGVSPKTVGVVKDIKSDQSVVIDFPDCTGWKGQLSEMEPVSDDDTCGSLTLDCNIKIGDKVCVKPSVETPKFLWGSVSHKSVGVVISVQGETVTVDFPQQKGWIGEVSEMELVCVDIGTSGDACFMIGNRVTVKSSVKDPKNGWGSVTHNSIGVIKRVQGESLTVDFPEQTDWAGVAAEMELIKSEVSEVLSLRPGARVRVKPTISTPAHGWGSVTKHSTGVVAAIDGTKVTVNFPEQSNWTGIVSEMEVVHS